jgi:RsmE family RNA methyltransferase
MGVGIVTALRDGSVDLQCGFESLTPPPLPAVDVLLAVPRPKVMRRLWAQLAALGVGRIVLTNAARVERNYFDTHVLTEACYRPLLIEGLQQARDTRVPRVAIRRQLKILVEDELDAMFPEGLRIVAHPRAATSVFAAVRHHSARRVLIAIGPEGGWTDFEIDLFKAHRFEDAGVGPRTLRSDTACVALLALAHEALATEPGSLDRG